MSNVEFESQYNFLRPISPDFQEIRNIICRLDSHIEVTGSSLWLFDVEQIVEWIQIKKGNSAKKVSEFRFGSIVSFQKETIR